MPDLNLKEYNNFDIKFHTYPRTRPIKQLIIHHTEGGDSIDNVVSGWNNNRTSSIHVNTPYIINREGVIGRLYSPYERYGFALGIKDNGGYLDSTSISIELTSYGYLKLQNGKYKTQYGNEIPENEVEQLNQPFKNYNFYHAYTQPQIDSLKNLLLVLSKSTGISLKTDVDKFWNFNSGVYFNNLSGLFTHTTLRTDKQDTYPSKLLKQMLLEFNKL